MLRPRRGPLRGTLQTKPLELDPIFWDIVGLSELRTRRPAFRIQGAFTVPTAIIAEAEHAFDLAAVVDAAAPVLNELQRAFERSERTYRTLGDFGPVLDQQASTDETMTTAKVVWLIALGRTQEAEQLVRESLAAGSMGGFLFPLGDFNKVALRYLTDGPSNSQ